MLNLNGNCPIREHTGDGHFVGRCDFYTPEGICPRHGYIIDYPNLDDREVLFKDRRFPKKEEEETPWWLRLFKKF